VTGEVTWRCQACFAKRGRKSPALLVGVVVDGRVDGTARIPPRRLGKNQTERDMAKSGWSGGSYNRTGSEPLDQEPYTNTCVCGHEVSKTGKELLDALRRQGQDDTAYI
jgi:hypothetical protein